jgi:hypothetical protein
VPGVKPILPAFAAATDGFIHHVVRHHDFHFHFGQKINRVFAPPINFSVPFLPAEPFDFRDGHSFDPELGQRLFDLLELERFDDGFQFFHLRVNAASRGILQPKVKRSTRSLSNAAMRVAQARTEEFRALLGMTFLSKFAKNFLWRLYCITDVSRLFRSPASAPVTR